MDGTTEPIIAVIGHPIAGNPSQFALERALEAMQLDWRVFSCDVEPEKIALALEGAEALGFRGVLVAPGLCASATDWYRQRDPGVDRIDCLVRDDSGRLVGSNEQRRWIDGQIERHLESLARDPGECLWLGDDTESPLIDADRLRPYNPPALPPDPDELAGSDVIIITESDDAAVLLEVEDWPRREPPTLVIDLTAGHPDIENIRRLGYDIVSADQRHVGTLERSLWRWTDRQPSTEVLREAIEEYQAV